MTGIIELLPMKQARGRTQHPWSIQKNQAMEGGLNWLEIRVAGKYWKDSTLSQTTIYRTQPSHRQQWWLQLTGEVGFQSLMRGYTNITILTNSNQLQDNLKRKEEYRLEPLGFLSKICRNACLSEFHYFSKLFCCP